MTDSFGAFEVHECLGTGGMATVHRATMEIGEGLLRDVALKRLLPQFVDDPASVEDFVREAKIAAQLHHPNIVSVIELGCVDQTYFIAMELLRGVQLGATLRRTFLARRPVPINVVLSILIDVADALDYVANGIDEYGEPMRLVHRDISPSNLFITDEGQVKIIDFGVAKSVAGRFATNTGLAKGKICYMASETIAGEPVDARSDIFSVGVVAWEMLAGRRLFKVVDEMTGARTKDPRTLAELNPDCPAALEEIIARALADDRDSRWPTAAALRQALEGVRRTWPERATSIEVERWQEQLIGGTEMQVMRFDAPPPARFDPPSRRISPPAVETRPKFIINDTVNDASSMRPDTHDEALPADLAFPLESSVEIQVSYDTLREAGAPFPIDTTPDSLRAMFPIDKTSKGFAPARAITRASTDSVSAPPFPIDTTPSTDPMRSPFSGFSGFSVDQPDDQPATSPDDQMSSQPATSPADEMSSQPATPADKPSSLATFAVDQMIDSFPASSVLGLMRESSRGEFTDEPSIEILIVPPPIEPPVEPPPVEPPPVEPPKRNPPRPTGGEYHIVRKRPSAANHKPDRGSTEED